MTLVNSFVFCMNDSALTTTDGPATDPLELSAVRLIGLELYKDLTGLKDLSGLFVPDFL